MAIRLPVIQVEEKKMEVNIEWKNGLLFEAEHEGFKMLVDADEKVGGTGKGPTPKGLTLVSLGGCTGMDVVSILKKMKVDFESLDIKVLSDLADEHPKKFEKIIIKYIFTGKDMSVKKIQKAISLSEDRYCGVSASLKPQVDITNVLIINGEEI